MSFTFKPEDSGLTRVEVVTSALLYIECSLGDSVSSASFAMTVDSNKDDDRPRATRG